VELGAGSRTEGVQALTEAALDLTGSHGRRLPASNSRTRVWACPSICTNTGPLRDALTSLPGAEEGGSSRTKGGRAKQESVPIAQHFG
jgi:hypothetical protein